METEFGTTRTMCERAKELIGMGWKVAIVTHSFRYADHLERYVPGAVFVPVTDLRKLLTLDSRVTILMVDHYVYESLAVRYSDLDMLSELRARFAKEPI